MAVRCYHFYPSTLNFQTDPIQTYSHLIGGYSKVCFGNHFTKQTAFDPGKTDIVVVRNLGKFINGNTRQSILDLTTGNSNPIIFQFLYIDMLTLNFSDHLIKFSCGNCYPPLFNNNCFVTCY